MTGVGNPALLAQAAGLPLTHEPLPAEQVRDGVPSSGYVTLAEFGAVEVGVWEMTPGSATDVEVDEVFVVLSGAATVEFLEPVAPAIALEPGSVVRLAAGTRTLWTVTETLRKVFIA